MYQFFLLHVAYNYTYAIKAQQCWLLNILINNNYRITMKITILVLVLAAVSAFAADQTNEERLALVQHLMKGHNLEGSHVEKFID